MNRGVISVLVSFGVLLAGVALAHPPQQAGSDAITVWDGVFAGAQANRGRGEYLDNCSSCHGQDLTQGSAPALRGDRFMENWREFNLSSLYIFIQERMPRNQGGTLTDAVYLDILTHILQENEFPMGDEELTAEALGSVRIVGADGPQPLPNNTLVAVVGCLSPNDDEWNLTEATEPARASSGYETPQGELDAARDATLGTETFELQNFAFLFPPFEPEPNVGHKLLVKGALFREERGNRIFAAAVEPVAESCAP